MSDRITRLEDSRWWWAGRILIPRRKRAAACEARGTHKPELVDVGRAKICWRCGAW